MGTLILDLLLVLLFIVLVLLWARVRKGKETDGAPLQAARWPHRWLMEAGLQGRVYVISFWAAKLMCAAGGAGVVTRLGGSNGSPHGFLILIAFLCFGSLPDLWLLAKRKARKRKVEAGLSYLLDLTVSFLRSGLSIEQGFFRAGREAFPRGHPISVEMNRLQGEVQSGQDRLRALDLLTERTGVEDLRMVAAILRITLRQGGEISETLGIQADLFRVKRREKALRRISVQSAMAVIPVFLCGMPIFLVVVYFPAILQVMELFTSLRTLH